MSNQIITQVLLWGKIYSKNDKVNSIAKVKHSNDVDKNEFIVETIFKENGNTVKTTKKIFKRKIDALDEFLEVESYLTHEGYC